MTLCCSWKVQEAAAQPWVWIHDVPGQVTASLSLNFQQNGTDFTPTLQLVGRIKCLARGQVPSWVPGK